MMHREQYLKWSRENKEPYPAYFCNLGLIDYEESLKLQDAARERIILEGEAPGVLFFLEHPHTYTHGRLAEKENLLFNPDALSQRGITVYQIDRGGDFTYHGPGQLVAYPIFDLKRLGLNVREYIHCTEEVVIRVLDKFGIKAGRHPRYMGAWVGEEKVCAVGVGVRKWVTKHGFAFNINTDLNFYQGIIPCGIKGKEVTSLQKLKGGVRQDFSEIMELARGAFVDVFNLELREATRREFEEEYLARR
jgi:lipoyl(octanoyl) transferase